MSDDVQPYTSPYAPPLSSSSSGSDIPANAAVPDLAMAWQAAPAITGAQASGSSGSSSSSSGGPQYYFEHFKLDFGAVHDTLDTILSAASTIVSAYENLKSEFESVKDTVFGQTATITQTEASDDNGGPIWNYNDVTYADPLRTQAQQFANGQNGQPGMNDAQAYALQCVANSMATLGQFIVLVQYIATSYANADFNSILPPVNVSATG